jgi:hypothetical protein
MTRSDRAGPPFRMPITEGQDTTDLAGSTGAAPANTI